MNVYFVQGVNGGPVKIGKAHNVKARIASLQTGNCEELNLVILLMNVAPEIEKCLHEKYDKYRIRGEWFSEKVLTDFILEYYHGLNFHCIVNMYGDAKEAYEEYAEVMRTEKTNWSNKLYKAYEHFEEA